MSRYPNCTPENRCGYPACKICIPCTCTIYPPEGQSHRIDLDPDCEAHNWLMVNQTGVGRT